MVSQHPPHAARVGERRCRVRGQVQGVGFRPFVYRLACQEALSGTVRNDPAGVTIDLRGSDEALDRFARRLLNEAPALARIDAAEWQIILPVTLAASPQLPQTTGNDPIETIEPAPSFRIIESDHTADAARGPVTVDTATCPDCLRELLNPRDRRFGHPLINCTNCGPRYTIIRDVPYDRPATTMAEFAMCPACRQEYHDPADRRFHAQPVCCPRCGPQVSLLDRAGCPIEVIGAGAISRRATGREAIRLAAAALRAGSILAMKGLGGFHLVVDAANGEAVAELRRRKRRDDKPFAIMVACLDVAEGLVDLSAEGRRLLQSPVRPIVLALRRAVPPSGGPRNRTAAATEAGRGAETNGHAGSGMVAPEVMCGSHRLGLMLPYTPLQHLLFADGLSALVMTSANVSDDPLVHSDAECADRLHEIADFCLTHDRPIERAVDDSIVLDPGSPPRARSDPALPSGASGAGEVHFHPQADVANSGPSLAPIVLRRARGLVPAPLSLPVTASAPGLCVGADLKNAVAFVDGDVAVLSQHIGDLSHTLASQRFRDTIRDLERLLGISPAWIAADLHPAYLSRQFALRFAREREIAFIDVQHHHAHLASLLAEHGRTDRIVGIVCDGVGLGTDGTAWGGEILIGDLAGFHRAGRMRPLRLPGGDLAAKSTGRCAFSWMWDALGPMAAEHEAARRVLPDDQERAAVATILARDLNCPPSSGLGRLFDAAAALLGVCLHNSYEAMSGQRMESIAAEVVPEVDALRSAAGLVAVEVDAEGFIELNHRPLLARILRDVASGVGPDVVPSLAFFFHVEVARALADAARLAAQRTGVETVGLTGGVFANAILTRLVREHLLNSGFDVLVHREVPPNDGGIAFGQAAVVAASF